jgi:hypothetical protein
MLTEYGAEVRQVLIKKRKTSKIRKKKAKQ